MRIKGRVYAPRCHEVRLPPMTTSDDFFTRAERLLERWEALLDGRASPPDWVYDAYRWRHDRLGTRLQPVRRPHRVVLDDLLCMDRQKDQLVRNTRQFVDGQPANNALLWGARGTGKSTLIKAVFNAFVDRGLRLIEVEKAHLVDLPDIVDTLDGRRERFLLFCDDLSFEADDAGYKAMKAVLEGSIAAPADNVLVYASSNRRHLLPEPRADNQDARQVDGEVADLRDEQQGALLGFVLREEDHGPFRGEEPLQVAVQLPVHDLRRPPRPQQMLQ